MHPAHPSHVDTLSPSIISSTIPTTEASGSDGESTARRIEADRKLVSGNYPSNFFFFFLSQQPYSIIFQPSRTAIPQQIVARAGTQGQVPPQTLPQASVDFLIRPRRLPQILINRAQYEAGQSRDFVQAVTRVPSHYHANLTCF